MNTEPYEDEYRGLWSVKKKIEPYKEEYRGLFFVYTENVELESVKEEDRVL